MRSLWMAAAFAATMLAAGSAQALSPLSMAFSELPAVCGANPVCATISGAGWSPLSGGLVNGQSWVGSGFFNPAASFFGGGTLYLSDDGTTVSDTLTLNFSNGAAGLPARTVGARVNGPLPPEIVSFTWTSYDDGTATPPPIGTPMVIETGGTQDLTAALLGAGLIPAGVQVTVQSVIATPEPASLALLGVGLAGLGWVRRRRA